MDDAGVLKQINALVHEEHALREQVQAGTIDDAEEHARLRDLEVQLDQCWDLLRQRRARREFGEDPAAAQVAPLGRGRGLPAVAGRCRGHSKYPPGYAVLRKTAHLGGGMAGYAGSKDDYLKRLRRVEGQVRGLQRMVEQDSYCIDVLTQVAAVTKALQAVSLGLLEDHVAHCVVDAARESDNAAPAKVREASEAIARLVRS